MIADVLDEGQHLSADLAAVAPLAGQVVIVLRQPWDQLVRFPTHVVPSVRAVIDGVDCGH